MAFVPYLENVFSQLGDVNEPSFTAAMPWARFNSATGKMEGAALPPSEPDYGVGAQGRILTANATGEASAQAYLTYENDAITLASPPPSVGGPVRISPMKYGDTVVGVHFTGGAYNALFIDGFIYGSEYRGSGLWVGGSYVGKAYGNGMRVAFRADGRGEYLEFYSAFQANSSNIALVAEMVASEGGLRCFATDPTKPALRVQAVAAQSGPLAVFQNNAEVILSKIMADGSFHAHAPQAAPAAAAFENSQFCFYLDESGGKLKVKVRLSDGTFKNGEVSLS